MPGVKVTTTARSGPSTPLSANSGQFFVAGLAAQGPTDSAVLIRGLADFEATFGTRATYSHLYDTIKMFFEEGGNQAYVTRIVGPAATFGTVTINDRAVSPLPTVQFTAGSQGGWSQNLAVEVKAGSVSSTVSIDVTLNGFLVEAFKNLATVEDIVSTLNRSQYLSVQSLGSSTPAPDNLPAVGEYNFSIGDDDRTNVSTTERQTALDLFVIGYGSGAVAMPGIGEDVHAMLIDHATRNRRIALLSMDVDSSISELTLAAEDMNTDAAGLFAPWVLVADQVGGTRPVPPEGYVAGARARAHDEVGAWRVPAGRIAASASLAGVVTEYTADESDNLDDAKVSVIRRINNSVRLYGWRSLSIDQANFGYLNGRDLLNWLTVEAERSLEDYVFQSIDGKGQLLATINGVLVGIVEPIRQAGGLYEYVDVESGESIDPGYLVETGPEVNSNASLAQNEIRARLSVRVSPVGALISLTIVKVGILSGF